MWLLKPVFKIIEPPPPLPPPPPKPKPVETDCAKAKIAEQNQSGLQLRNRLERVFAPVVEAVEQALDSSNARNERVARIALENAPLLVLPPGNLPADPQEYIANSRLRENVSLSDSPFTLGNDKEYGDNTDDDLSDNFSPADVGEVINENEFLDLDNDMRGELGRNDAPVFYQFQEAEYGADGEMTKPPALTYHIFHAFNDAPTPFGYGTQIADHEGDWERVTYRLNPRTLKPETAILSAHEDEHARVVPFQNLNKDSRTGRPLIYVADGSHANYEKPRDDYPLPAGTKDKTATDQNGDGIVNETDGAVIFDTAGNLQEVTSQPWYPTGSEKGARWGEISATQNLGPLDVGLLSSGPQGPSPGKGAVPQLPVFAALASHLDTTPQEFNTYFNSLPTGKAEEFVEKARLVDKDDDGVYYDHQSRYNANGGYHFEGTVTLVDLENWMRSSGYSDAPGL